VSSTVLDASALLAYLRDEPGADLVADWIADGSVMSSVSVAEVLSTVADRGADPVRLLERLIDRGLLDGAIVVEPFTTADVAETARMRPLTRKVGLSLGDRACLAVARRLGVPAVTADTAWESVDVDVDVRAIR
jgi:ribonuclease VapC